MSARRIIGIALVTFGVVVVLWGGLFWTDKDKIIDAGPVEVTTEHREGFSVPPIVGGVAFVVGAVLLLLPKRRTV